MNDAGDLLTTLDPRGLIREAYRIDGIVGPSCRSIYLDWALGLPQSQDGREATAALLAHYGARYPDHPMTAVLREGVETRPRDGRRSRSRRAG